MDESYTQYQSGVALMQGGDYAGAVAVLQASALSAPHFKTLELLGECLVELNRLREAIVPLAAATTLNGGVGAPALLAEVFWKLGEHHDAETLANIALSRDANNRKARHVQHIIAHHQQPPQPD